MPCDINCKSHVKAERNGVVDGYRLMLGEVLCTKVKRKLSAVETVSDTVPDWCPKGVDKKASLKAQPVKVKAAQTDTQNKTEQRTKKNKAPAPKSVPASALELKVARIHELVPQLNRYRDEYYNKNAPSVSDDEYDRQFDELLQLEQDTGCVMSNSPTQTVGYKVVSGLETIKHPVPLLSLEKTKSTEELVEFTGSHQIMLMHKLDGLTIELDYSVGLCNCASTRGDGDEGEIVTHNVPAISGIPARIPYEKKLVVVGEAYIHDSDFEMLKGILVDSNGKPYSNARNLAAGSVRCYNPAECVKRLLHFVPFNVKEGLDEDPVIANSKSAKLNKLAEFGFGKCEYFLVDSLTVETAEKMISALKESAEQNDIPIDGIVCTYNDIAFSRACGRTGHHYKDGKAFKFEDDQFETVLRSIKWTPTRSGDISSVALFDSVEIDGCKVKRATLHNLTFIKELELMPGCRILVSKRNMIIPHVEGNLDRGRFNNSIIPASCPCCGHPTRVQISRDKDTGRDVEKLHCDNSECETQRLRQFVHFTGKKAMNIDGLSTATLDRFIESGFLDTFMDIYHLDRYKDEIIGMDGFDTKSYESLWDAIQASRNTTFERYVIAMDIPMIGRRASGSLCRQFSGSLDKFEAAVTLGYDFTTLSGFGDAYHQNIHDWFKKNENRTLWKELQKEMSIHTATGTESASPVPSENVFTGKTIVATGKLKNFSRSDINAKILSLGAIVGDSVTQKTDYVVVGEKPGSKLDKARTLGVKVLTEDDFINIASEA